MSITINHQTNDISATSGSLTINGATSVTNNNQLTNGAGYITSSASISGNAATATVLQTARTINGVSFNGSANITVADSTKAPIASPTFTGTATSPTFNASSVTNGGFQGIDADTALIPSFTWTSDQNTGMWHAAADSIGFTTAGVNRLTLSTTALTSTLNIAAPTFSGSGASLTSLNGSNITTGTVAAARVATLNQNTTGSSGSTTGNAATATALQTARTINGVSFNGTANITVADATKLPLAGGTATGVIKLANASTEFGTPTTGSTLKLWGSTAGASSTLATSNGNLHIDAHTGSFATYLNYFRGTGGILFGNGAGAWVAHMDSSGSLTLNGTVAATSFSGDGSGLTGIATTKVWANFNGETGGTIRGSFNVASVTDMGVGRYRVNFSTSFANANYSGVSTAGANISDYPSQVDTLDHNSFQGASQTGNLPVFSVDHDDGVQDDCAYMYVNCIG